VKRLLWQVIKWSVGVGLIGAIVWFNRDEFARALSGSADWELQPLLVAGLLCLIGVLLTFYRWYVLVRALDLPFRAVDAARLGFVGFFFSIVLPGSIGGDLVKAGFLAREQRRRTVAVSTIILDRLVGLYGLVLLAALVGAFYWQQAWAAPQLRVLLVFIWVTAGSILAVVLLVPVLPLSADRFIDRLQRRKRFGRIGGILCELARALQMYRHRGRHLALATALAVVGHVGFVLSFYFTALAVPGKTPPLGVHYLIIPVGMVVQAIPITPGNIGVAEGVYNELYKLADPGLRDTVKGVLVTLAQRLIYLGVAFIGLACYLPLRKTVRQVMAEERMEPSPNGRLAEAADPAKVNACDRA
jgi:uncharacterized protein (TIRG00374 family)